MQELVRSDAADRLGAESCDEREVSRLQARHRYVQLRQRRAHERRIIGIRWGEVAPAGVLVAGDQECRAGIVLERREEVTRDGQGPTDARVELGQLSHDLSNQVHA